CQQNDSSPLTF
nr:immunoglobulin light chain junction region [Macaca mulatta]